MTNSPKKIGHVAILGRPNVGKSTLLNHFIGEKIAGVSPKPQTTRDSIKGILSEERGQIIFVDTPGVHAPHDRLGRHMNRAALTTTQNADLVYLMVPPRMPAGKDEKRILEIIKQENLPTFLLVNQIDRVSREKVLPVLEYYSRLYDFKDLFPISAKNGLQMDVLLEETFKALPDGDPLFPEDQLSDATERFHVQEIIREKLFLLLKQEVPYGTAVMIEKFTDATETEKTRIEASIIVDRTSHKSIVIGKGGAGIKQIGVTSRGEIESFLGRPVHLELWVQVSTGWKEDRERLREMGY